MGGQGPEAPSASSGIPSPRLSAARLACVQALYQAELTDTPMDSVVLQFLKFRSEGALDEGEAPIKPDAALFTEIVRGTHSRSEEIDDLLRATLPAIWPLERIETLLRCILRAGIYELLARRGVPARVAISEYVDLADAFFNSAERGMANAVLDRLAHRLRDAEFNSPEESPDVSTAAKR